MAERGATDLAADTASATARHNGHSPAGLALSALGLVALFGLASMMIVNPLTYRQFWHQDLWLLALMILAAAGAALVPGRSGRLWLLNGWTVAAICAAAFLFTYLGHYLILLGHDMSRDEQMANFDAAIFAHGRLAWPIPSSWQGQVAALNAEFLAFLGNGRFWVSNYLPMNAAVRALAGLLGDVALAGPILTALSLPLLWGCARRIWPDDREAQAVPVILLAVSGQALFAGMTAFAMTAHLFFNLLWLRLFLADRRGTDAAAIVTGFVATGLHQPLFHPMFVAPFLLLLLQQRRWGRLGGFVLAYALIGAFWLAWPHTLTALFAAAPSPVHHAAAAAPPNGFLDRLLGVIAENDEYVSSTGENLLRFCTWQHVLLLPLLLAARRAVIEDPMARALALGIAIPIVVMAVILPWQGNGFGYRYLHPALGNAALLAGYGWRALIVSPERLRAIFHRATVANLVLVLPLQAWLAHAQYAPFARASAAIDAAKTDFAIVSNDDAQIAEDVVINRPDLSNRPLRLLADQLGPLEPFARFLCRARPRVAVTTPQFLQPLIKGYGGDGVQYASGRVPELRRALERAGCKVTLLNAPTPQAPLR